MLESIPRLNRPKTYTVSEVSQLLGVSRMLVYEEIWRVERGEPTKFKLPFIRVGRRILFPVSAIDSTLGLDPSDTPSPPVEAA